MRDTRTNTDTAILIEESLQLLQWDGRYVAAHFLREHGVGFGTIVRVLAPAARRRHAPAGGASADHRLRS